MGYFCMSESVKFVHAFMRSGIRYRNPPAQLYERIQSAETCYKLYPHVEMDELLNVVLQDVNFLLPSQTW